MIRSTPGLARLALFLLLWAVLVAAGVAWAVRASDPMAVRVLTETAPPGFLPVLRASTVPVVRGRAATLFAATGNEAI